MAVKHYALNSMENARFTVDVTADEATLHEVYLPHFRRVVEEGADAIMTAYNSVNGEWAGQNEHLIGDPPRRVGLPGVTVSDFIWGLRDAAPRSRRASTSRSRSVSSAPSTCPPTSRRSRRLGDRRRAARGSSRCSCASPPAAPRRAGAAVVFSAEHRALAREAAARAMVLLQNEPVDGAPVLPLDPAVVRTVAVAGASPSAEHRRRRFVGRARPRGRHPARRPGRPDSATSAYSPPATSRTPLRGRRRCRRRGGRRRLHRRRRGRVHRGRARSAAPSSSRPTRRGRGDAWADRPRPAAADAGSMRRQRRRRPRSLRLHDADVALIRAVAAANPRTVVVIVTAGAVITEEWRDEVPAVLVGWYSGSEGGSALADVLSARWTPPAGCRSRSRRRGGPARLRPERHTAMYDRWHGQRLLDRDGRAGRVPARVRAVLHDLRAGGARASGEPAARRCPRGSPYRNTGDRAGRHVVQLYASRQDAGDDFPRRVLLGFARVRWTRARPCLSISRVDPPAAAVGRRAPRAAGDRGGHRAAAHAADASGPTARIPARLRVSARRGSRSRRRR